MWNSWIPSFCARLPVNLVSHTGLVDLSGDNVEYGRVPLVSRIYLKQVFRRGSWLFSTYQPKVHALPVWLSGLVALVSAYLSLTVHASAAPCVYD